ncbi:MAG: hypothetical protein MJ172_00175 [Clostridia bacterium]|nr:hypothetical protein [Clostridia bacterium]
MQNYSLKDQVFAIMIGVLALMFIIFWFFIKPTKANYETLVITRDTLRVREAECDALKQQNDETSRKISSLETEIKSVEESFLPVLNNENFEQYLLNLFEEKDCPYLSKVTVENIDCDEVTLPDGTVSIDRLACSRVRLEYAATDGYCVPQYNYSPDLSTYGKLDAAYIVNSMAAMGTYEFNQGYAGFLDALKTIENLAPSCVKLNRIEVDSNLGYNKLIAEIDFYAIDSIHRVSSGASSYAFVNWSGAETPDSGIGHGIVGVPLLVRDEMNAFYGCMIVDGDLEQMADRPFATYYSIGIFVNLANNGGLYIHDPEADEEAFLSEGKSIPLVPAAGILYATEDTNATDVLGTPEE